MTTPRDFWEQTAPALPLTVQHGLAAAGRAPEASLRLSAEALNRLQDTPERLHPALLDICRDALLDAWEEAPLSRDIAASVLDLDARAPWLGRELKQILAAAARIPDDLAQLQTRLDQARHTADWNALAGLINEIPAALSSLAPLFSALQARAALESGDPDHAADRLRRIPVALARQWPGLAELRAAVFTRQNRADQAATMLALALENRPWRVRPLLALRHMLAGDDPPAPVPDTAALLLCPANPDATRELLQRLRSTPGVARIIAITHRSDVANVIEALRAASDSTPPLQVVETPCHIGPGAALAWLLACWRDTAPSAHAALIDATDAAPVLPPEWLTLLHRALDANPPAVMAGLPLADRTGRLVQAEAHLALPSAPDHALQSELARLQDPHLAHGRALGAIDAAPRLRLAPAPPTPLTCFAVPGVVRLLRPLSNILDYAPSISLNTDPQRHTEPALRLAAAGLGVRMQPAAAVLLDAPPPLDSIGGGYIAQRLHDPETLFAACAGLARCIREDLRDTANVVEIAMGRR